MKTLKLRIMFGFTHRAEKAIVTSYITFTVHNILSHKTNMIITAIM